MDEAKQNLTGSPSRDTFKRRHKDLCKQFYACDLDFVLIAKEPYRIISFLDYKKLRENITFSEVIAYNILKQIAPVYIVRGKDPEKGPFVVWEFKNGDPKPDPPTVELELIKQCETWAVLEIWEMELRNSSFYRRQ